MADLSKLSDDELRALYNSTQTTAPAPPVAAAPVDFTKLTDDELRAQYQATRPSSGTADVAKSAGVGLGKGAIGLAGLVGDLSGAGAKGLEYATNYVSDKLGVDRYQRPDKPSILENIPTSASIQKGIEDRITGEFYKPQTTLGKYAQSIGEMVPATAIGPGGAIMKGLSAIGAGTGSEAAGQLYEGSAAEPYARVAGAVAGGLSPIALTRAVTPLPTSPARQRLVDLLQGEGVTSMTAGQVTGNKRLKALEDAAGNSPMAGSRHENIIRQGQEQFTEAALRRAGTGPMATPEVLAQNQRRLGDQFNDLSARNNLTPDNQFVTDLVGAARDYRVAPPSQQRAIVQGYVDDIVGHVNAGAMPGPQYQEMRSRMSRQADALRMSDPTLSNALRDMRNALDNGMERSIPVGPDKGLWGQTRREYGAQKVIEKAASRAGEDTAEGIIVPANLRNAVAAENRGAYARGQGDFSELSRAGASVLKPLPSSGTAERTNAFNLLNQATLGAVPAITGRTIMNPLVQRYLGNQALSGVEGTPGLREALIRAMMGQDRTQLLGGPAN